MKLGTKISFTGTLVVVGGCWNCGTNAAIPESLYRKARDEGRTFYCPSCGESQVFTKSENERLRDELKGMENARDYWMAEERKEREARLNAERRVVAQKAAKTRLKNRIAAGVCPCCKRHFANVQKHIAGQHPEFASTDTHERDTS